MEPGIPRKVTSTLDQKSCHVEWERPGRRTAIVSKDFQLEVPDFWVEDRMMRGFV